MSPFARRRSASPLRAAAAVFLLTLLAAAGPAAATGVLDPFAAPLEPPGAGGVERADRALAKLPVHRRLLVIGAHPDDEDTTLLALVARGLGGEAAYLSLSRGEGGQNLIGPELGPALGLIRSRELLAARQVDGARQFFTRAYDFGYTRSLDETLTLWPREVLLEDAVRVIRRFRPQVVVSIFPPDSRAGHGQHQAAGAVAAEAFHRAGDPAAFPQLAAEGLAPWEPEVLYRSTWWEPPSTTLTLPLGVLEPYGGRSVLQLALASRSRHRSQDMGMLQPLGPGEARLAWVAGAGGPEDSELFAGVATELAALAELLPEGEARREVARRLAAAAAGARAARAALTPVDPAAAVPAIAAVVRDLRAARAALPDDAALGAAPGLGALHAAALVDEKVALAETALAAAAGVAVDAVADRPAAAPGDAWDVETMAWFAAAGPAHGATGAAAPRLTAVELVSPAGLLLATEEEEVEERSGWDARQRPNPDPERGFHVDSWQVRVPAGAAPTVPYFLARPLDGALYDWSAAPPEVRGEPFGPPPLVARFHLAVAGVPLTVEREVTWRFRDQAVGEVRAPLRVVPAVTVAVAPDLLLWPTAHEAPRRLAVNLASHALRPVAGRLEVTVPPGWPAVAPVPFELPPGGSAELALEVTAPPGLAPGEHRVEVAAVVGGARHAADFPQVDYEHIRATPYPEPAVARVAALDLELPPLARVGYVRGASDRVPEALIEVGVPLVVLGAEELLAGDLDRFDAIVVGSRAYETDPSLAAANARLLDYARRGGLVIVQYQQYAFVEGGFAPFPLEIARPHGRITDEAAPVRALDPDHPLLHEPNEIAAADWGGWVQERGLYMPATWDAAYLPLLAMADPEQPEQRGAVLVAPLGEGTYVYTGLAFFRQLPAGVPGAYRLFANLLALGAR